MNRLCLKRCLGSGWQRNSKFQTPRSREAPRTKLQPVLRFGAWNLELLWSLVLGAWSLCSTTLLTILISLLLLSLTSCVTKSKAKAQAHEAFFAGQQQAMAMAHAPQAQGPGAVQGQTVTFIGQVRNPVIPWTDGLTVAQALVMANYLDASDPREIFVVRNGQATRIDPKRLLSGEDMPLQPGDIIQIVQ